MSVLQQVPVVAIIGGVTVLYEIYMASSLALQQKQRVADEAVDASFVETEGEVISTDTWHMSDGMMIAALIGAPFVAVGGVRGRTGSPFLRTLIFPR